MKKILLRKIIHASSGLIPFLMDILGREVTVVLLALISILFVLSEKLRLEGKALPFITWLTIMCLRKEEENRFAIAPLCLALAIIILITFLPSEAKIIIPAFAIADPLAELVGIKGRIMNPINRQKTLEGSIIFFLSFFLVLAILNVNVSYAILISLLAMVAEARPIIDDNLSTPIVACLVLKFLPAL